MAQFFLYSIPKTLFFQIAFFFYIYLLYLYHNHQNKYNLMQSLQGQLQQKWTLNTQVVIEGVRGKYKIIPEKFLGRGGFGIVFAALRQYKNANGEIQYDEVVLKQFKKSQKWRSKDDWDKQLVILQKFGRQWKSQYVVEVIDIFQNKQNRRYYLVTKYAQEGSLADRIKQSMNETEVHQFTLRSAQILNYLHYDALKDYKSTTKDQEKEVMAVIHRDFKPANLVYFNKNVQKSMFLIDFGIAKVGYANKVHPYSNCGTNNYKAPQIAQSDPYDPKVDIYSFGCTLYQIFNQGQRLLGTHGLNIQGKNRQEYVKGKLMELEQRLKAASDKIKDSFKWIKILVKCLEYDPKNRWSSKELLAYINQTSGMNYKIDANPYFKISPLDLQVLQKKQAFELSFQIYRVNMIQDILFQIFEHLYFGQPRLSKFITYTLVKYISIFIMQKFQRCKDRARLFKNKEKLDLVKRLIQDKKVIQIRDKAQEKIVQQLQRELVGYRGSAEGGLAQEMGRKYPELLKEGGQARRIFYQFCYQRRQQIRQHQKISQMIGIVILSMDDVDAYSETRITRREYEEHNVEYLSLKKLFNFKKAQEERMKHQTLLRVFQACQVEGTVRSGANREEIKSDVAVERR